MAADARPRASRASDNSLAWMRLTAAVAALCVTGTWAAMPTAAQQKTEQSRADGKVTQKQGDDKRPALLLKATPPLGFSPLRVHASVDVRGGPDDFADFYCPAIEWDWGDGTVSENSEDCEPYEEGTSTIRRRFAADHTYQQGGAYRLAFRLKQKSKVIASATTNVQVRAGARDEFGR